MCAETYPFLRLMKYAHYPTMNTILRRSHTDYFRNHTPREEVCYGWALHCSFDLAQQYDDRLSGPVWRAVCAPCANCTVLIGLYVQNFLPTYGPGCLGAVTFASNFFNFCYCPVLEYPIICWESSEEAATGVEQADNPRIQIPRVEKTRRV